MPLGRKHLRRSRDAPTGGMALQRSTSNLGFTREEVNFLDVLANLMGSEGGAASIPFFWAQVRKILHSHWTCMFPKAVEICQNLQK